MHEATPVHSKDEHIFFYKSYTIICVDIYKPEFEVVDCE